MEEYVEKDVINEEIDTYSPPSNAQSLASSPVPGSSMFGDHNGDKPMGFGDELDNKPPLSDIEEPVA